VLLLVLSINKSQNVISTEAAHGPNVSGAVERPRISSLALFLPVLLFVIPQGSAFAVAVAYLPTAKKSHLDRSCSRSYREQRSGETPAFRLWLCFCLSFCLSSRRDLLLPLQLLISSLPKKRHLDRSCSRSYREQRSGETPAFRLWLCFCLSFCLSSRRDLLLPLQLLISPLPKHVISTEAAHGPIVSSAAERPPHFVFAFVFACPLFVIIL
jgi:hypothetical protein